MTSVEIWLKALGEFGILSSSLPINLTPCQDLLFERLQRNYDLSKIKAIAGAAQVGDIFLIGKWPTMWEIESMVYLR